MKTLAYDTILISFLSELDVLADLDSLEFDRRDYIHPDWMDYLSDEEFDQFMVMHDEMSEASDLFHDVVEHLFPYRPVHTCALVTHYALFDHIDYTV